ncbi:uncharacterized protein PHALS_02395 [Plasmopara halstedii]|uniref:Uncharacterized protein n=1 Tax=Plasmopara halstedii TaxID=4781 RepID=A0A0P1AX62_PLAHL|nr:uncharacterized protein PHALS_02395 [Plasmopara halstedii]CEG46073.1 hypothetical protein PHALS_02395 [Plasmopara halstedii]|eukprot:XP_024582442.1 hypothetical protein PHALS_02395 [Plasmopara halstedii]
MIVAAIFSGWTRTVQGIRETQAYSPTLLNPVVRLTLIVDVVVPNAVSNIRDIRKHHKLTLPTWSTGPELGAETRCHLISELHEP